MPPNTVSRLAEDGGTSWRECSEVARLRERFKWYLPYSDGAGCVRGFAFLGSRAYAAVEVGGVIRSEDYGQTWTMAPGSSGNPFESSTIHGQTVHPDVHSIYTHPASPDLVCAATGGGFYVSEDGGKRWMHRYDCYCRAAWWDPVDIRHVILGPADGVDRGGRIEETKDMGKTWQPASEGLQVPWIHHMVERFYPVNDELFAILSNGEVLRSQIDLVEWQLFESGGRVNAVTAGG